MAEEAETAPAEDDALLERLEALLLEDPSVGYRKLHGKLKTEEAFKSLSLNKARPGGWPWRAAWRVALEVC
eukprot:Skav230576  [mRNA]  locus=scaffold971:161076:161923:- [translate_table: standard]